MRRQLRSAAVFNWEHPDTSWLSRPDLSPPQFPTDALGEASDYVLEAARGAGAPPDYVAAMLLSATGALLGKICSVSINSDWMEPVSVWCAIIGPPSSGKTPASKPIRQALGEIESRWGDAHSHRIEAEIAAAKKAGAEPEEIDQLKEKLKLPPRLITNDATLEALARVEQSAERGLLVLRDELAGLIRGLERYNAGVDRACYLEAYDQGPFTFDRVKAGRVKIDNHCFSVFGGLQPDRFRTLLSQSGDDDGFAARLLLFWPKPTRPTTIPDGANHEPLQSALDRLDRLPELSGGRRLELQLTEEAFSLFERWYGNNHAGRHGTEGKMGSAFGKLPGVISRLSGILHLMDWAFDTSPTASIGVRISEDPVERAIQLVEAYFVPQIKRAYDNVDLLPDERLAYDILRYCERHQQSFFNCRTARREWGLSGASQKGSAGLFEAAAALLEAAGWVQRRAGNGKDYEVNPLLHEKPSSG